MNELPGGWTEASIADVTTPFVSVDPTKTPDQAFRYVDIGSIDNKTQTITDPKSFLGRDAPSRARRLIRTGDTLFSTVRTYLKNIALVPRELDGELTSTGIAVLRPNDAVDAGYLFRWACSDDFVGELSSAQDGTMYPAVSDRDVAVAAIPLPPLPEQRRIVAKIDSLTGKSKRARDHLDHIPRLVEKYKQAVLAAAFRGDLTREWRKAHDLPDLRGVRLGDVAEGFNYGSAAKSANQGAVPVLRMGNIQDGKLDWSDLVFTDEPAEIDKYRLVPGDVLFNRTNSPALVGKTALYDGDREAIYAGYLIKIRCKQELLPAFLTYCLNSPMGRAYSWAVKSDGVSQSNINAKKLAAFSFDLPSPQEQAEIVRRIETAFIWINRLASEATSARRLIDRLDQAVLTKAFRGELVPQDPEDEPACVLLERIKAERGAAPKARRGRRATA